MSQDRKQACDAYAEQYPDDEWCEELHIVVSDYNFEDHWLFNRIVRVASKLENDESNAELQRRFKLLVELLSLPMPDGWDEEDAI